MTKVSMDNINCDTIRKLYLYQNFTYDSSLKMLNESKIEPFFSITKPKPFYGIQFRNAGRNTCYIDTSMNLLLSSQYVRHLVQTRHQDCDALKILKQFLDNKEGMNDGEIVKDYLNDYYRKTGQGTNPFDNTLQHDCHDLLTSFINSSALLTALLTQKRQMISNKLHIYSTKLPFSG